MSDHTTRLGSIGSYFLLIGPTLRAIRHGRGDFGQDAQALFRHIQPAPQAISTENIPPQSSFILVFNHYDRPGLRVWWTVIFVALTVCRYRTTEPKSLRVVFTGEWPFPIIKPITRWFSDRVSKAYGLSLLPPVEPGYRLHSALAIRRLVALMRHNPPPLLGISPEGKSIPSLEIHTPPSGAGVFLSMLANGRLHFVPAGIYEAEEGVLTANFGPPFRLFPSSHSDRSQLDRQVSQALMVAIGRLLPERMWGIYRDEIRESLH